MTLVVEIEGLELHGYHGLLEGEREAGQRFLFDVRLEVGPEAARTDRIEDAVDYREVTATVREVSDSSRFTLLETLAQTVADALYERFPVERVRVRVRKPDVRLAAPVEWTAVTAEAGPPSA